MLKVNRKPQETIAVQWTGWNLMEILTFIGAHLDSPETEEHFEKFNELQDDYRSGILPFLIGNTKVIVGEWVVIEDDKKVLLSNDDFKKHYNKA